MARKTEKAPTASGLIQLKKSGETVKRMTVYVGVPLYKRLGHHLVETDRDMSAVVSEAIAEYLDRHDK